MKASLRSPPQFLNQGPLTRSARLQASVPTETWTTFNISSSENGFCSKASTAIHLRH